MIMDNELEFSRAQALTADAPSENVIDLGRAGALGKDLVLVVKVTNDADFDSSGDGAGLTISLETSAAVGSGYVKRVSSPLIAQATMVKKALLFKIKLPKNLLRYLRLDYDVDTESFTAGKLDAYLVPDQEHRK